jgi:hypothetical protein
MIQREILQVIYMKCFTRCSGRNVLLFGYGGYGDYPSYGYYSGYGFGYNQSIKRVSMPLTLLSFTAVGSVV